MKYPKLVITEAKNLRELISEHEKARLNLEIDPEHNDKCIYGRIAGNCNSFRAIDLIERCCPRVYSPSRERCSLHKAKINGSPKKKERKDYWSPIEVFIYEYRDTPEVIRKLADFISGKINEL